MNFDPITALVAISGLILQGVVGWVYVQILKDEVRDLRIKSDAHAEELAEHRIKLDEHARDIYRLEQLK